MEPRLRGRGRYTLATVLAVATLAHAETRPGFGGKVDATLLGAPATLDPALASTHAERAIADLVFDGLYRLGPGGVVRPHLADGLPTGTAGTRITIRLRPGATFHDGTPLTAADVAASLTRLRATPAEWIIAPIAQIRALPDAIEIDLRAITPDLATFLAMPRAAITKAGKAPGERPIGSGPFLVEAVNRNARTITLKAFDDHFAGRPYLDHLTLHWFDTADGEARQFETGASQLSARGVAAFSGSQPKFRARDVEGPGAVLAYVGFGRAHKDVLGDVAFRRALDHALARGALTSVSSGERVTPVRFPVPLEAGGAALPASDRSGDLVAAQAALAEAAVRVPALRSGKLGALSLRILVDDSRPDDLEIAERVARALDKLGIASTLKAVSAVALRDAITRGTTDLYIGQLAAPATASWVWWAEAFAAGGSRWAAKQLATGKLDPAAAQRELAATLPIVPLMFRGVRLWHRTDVRGVAFDAAGVPCFADMFLFGAPVRSGKP